MCWQNALVQPRTVCPSTVRALPTFMLQTSQIACIITSFDGKHGMVNASVSSSEVEIGLRVRGVVVTQHIPHKLYPFLHPA